MHLINAQPRPRVLFEHVPGDILTTLSSMVPTFKIVTDAYTVHEPEYDILVTFSKDAGKRSKHLHVLSFGAERCDGLTRVFTTQANELFIPSGIDPRFRRLVDSTIIPSMPEHLKVTWGLTRRSRTTNQTETINAGDLDGKCTPLLHVSAAQRVYALLRPRQAKPESALSLLLPDEITNHAEWFRLFLELVADRDPDSVPTPLDWPASDQWAPPSLREAVRAIKDLHRERETIMAELDAKEQSLAGNLEHEAQAAATGPQLLLTSDGDDLTAAVLRTLTSLGFTVQDMDDHHDEKTKAKLEDLRVTDPTDPDWDCLAEVKGYLRGAKVSDVPQITGRPVAAYTKETGEIPTTVWHIVNAWRKTDPSTRPKAIDNDAIDLKPLTDAGGALIDTRDLFLAWRDIENGTTQAEEVRKSLKTATTRWTYTRAPRI